MYFKDALRFAFVSLVFIEILASAEHRASSLQPRTSRDSLQPRTMPARKIRMFLQLHHSFRVFASLKPSPDDQCPHAVVIDGTVHCCQWACRFVRDSEISLQVVAPNHTAYGSALYYVINES